MPTATFSPKSDGRMDEPTPKPRKGYTYFVEDDVRRRYAEWSPAEKLRWLAEAADFIEKASTPEAKRIREMFRRGEL